MNINGRLFIYGLMCGLMTLAGSVSLSVATASPASTQTSADTGAFDRHRLLAHLARDVMLPTYTRFEATAATLHDTTQTLCAAPTPDHLKTAQQAWLQAAVLWKRTEAFQLGPTRTYVKSIDFWPTRPRLLQNAIQRSQPMTVAQVEFLGASAQGLAALEYLLFDPQTNPTAVLDLLHEGPAATRRCEYLMALAAHMAQQAQYVAKLWRPGGPDLAGDIARAGRGSATYDSVHQAISVVVNHLLRAVEGVQNKKIAKPLRGNGRTPWPQAAEAWRSGTSVAHMVGSLEGAFDLYRGAGDTPNRIGFDTYLAALGSPLGDQITRHFEAALQAVRTIPSPFHVAIVEQPDKVEAAYRAIHALLILLKVDMTNLLGVTVDFSDNDGD